MEKHKLFLQLFTEGDDGGTGDGNGDGSGTDGGNNEPMSFDDFLGQEGNQAEFDRRVNKAVKTAVTNAEEKWKALTDDKLTEAEKLAKMTKEEKAEYRAKKAEKELEDLKKMNARTELAKTARKMLADENINIPDELLSNLVADDAEGTKTAVESFAKMYKEAVQAAVKEAIKGKPPKAGTGGGNTITKEQIMDIKDPIERQKMIRENINLFQ
nr:MAG TPA: capsid scaffolding protein [Caudoviricetes sp.]